MGRRRHKNIWHTSQVATSMAVIASRSLRLNGVPAHAPRRSSTPGECRPQGTRASFSPRYDSDLLSRPHAQFLPCSHAVTCAVHLHAPVGIMDPRPRYLVGSRLGTPIVVLGRPSSSSRIFSFVAGSSDDGDLGFRSFWKSFTDNVLRRARREGTLLAPAYGMLRVKRGKKETDAPRRFVSLRAPRSSRSTDVLR